MTNFIEELYQLVGCPTCWLYGPIVHHMSYSTISFSEPGHRKSSVLVKTSLSISWRSQRSRFNSHQFFFHSISLNRLCTMSVLNINKKMIRSFKFCGSLFVLSKSIWIFWKIVNVFKSWKNFPLEFNCFSIKTHCVFVWGIPLKIFHLSCPFRIDDSWILVCFSNARRTESAKTQTFAFVHLIVLSLNRIDVVHDDDELSRVCTFGFSSEYSVIAFSLMFNTFSMFLNFSVLVDFRSL